VGSFFLALIIESKITPLKIITAVILNPKKKPHISVRLLVGAEGFEPPTPSV
jgi:hypothetical protein